jgi:hypothetical protein
MPIQNRLAILSLPLLELSKVYKEKNVVYGLWSVLSRDIDSVLSRDIDNVSLVLYPRECAHPRRYGQQLCCRDLVWM